MVEIMADRPVGAPTGSAALQADEFGPQTAQGWAAAARGTRVRCMPVFGPPFPLPLALDLWDTGPLPPLRA